LFVVSLGNALVVDDNADSADMLAEVLQAMGYVAHVAHDGPAALRLATDHVFDLALLDIGLPQMDGYELAGRLRSTPGGRTTRLIAVTGYGQEADARAAEEAGFDTHLVKPVDIEDLERVIRRETRGG
jgi:CheY-like chemotaxis protein